MTVAIEHLEARVAEPPAGPVQPPAPASAGPDELARLLAALQALAAERRERLRAE